VSSEALRKDGWTLALICGGDHLHRIVEIYEELGLKVNLEEVDPGECRECRVCYEAGGETIYRVYTRAKEQGDK